MPAAPQLHFLSSGNCGALLSGIPSCTKHILIGCLVQEGFFSWKMEIEKNVKSYKFPLI